MRLFPIFAALSITVANAANWYEEMKIGPAWSNTFEDTRMGETRVAALKGILVDLGNDYKALFDTETLRLVTVYQGGINWGGTPWTGQHGPLVGLRNEAALFNTAAGPGWADADGSFEDKRAIPGFGNLGHARYDGYFRHGSKIVFESTVHGTRILETLDLSGGALTRSFLIGPRKQELVLRLADADDALKASATGVVISTRENNLLATFPKGGAETIFQIALGRGDDLKPAPAPDFKSLVAGGAPLYPEIIETRGVVSTDMTSPYVTDVVTLPAENPWKSNLRFGGFDFIDEDSAALSSWNGDVWVVRGLKGDWQSLKWQRVASGLFETLGLKVVNGLIHVNGRDQITQLVDLNGDGETDHFKVFNRDVIISSNFHEFAFDLQTDKQGNFYFSKAAPVRGGGRGFDRILPHHGIVAKISPDGKKFEVMATGLRAPGGLGIGPNGEITTGENEGTWQPACKINFFDGRKPVFFGTEDSRQGLTDAPFTPPLCYLPMDVDNSGASQVWVPQGSKFGLGWGEMLHLSYGQSSIFRVLNASAAVKLPITLQSSAMRARFHPDGSLYVAGFRGWQSNAVTESAFQRVRHHQKAVVPVPSGYLSTSAGVELIFDTPLDPELAEDVASYSAERWNYVRGSQYGSGEFSVDDPDEAAEKDALVKESKGIRKRDTAAVESAKLSEDKRKVELVIAGMKPSMQLKVTYDLEDENGTVMTGEIYSSVQTK